MLRDEGIDDCIEGRYLYRDLREMQQAGQCSNDNDFFILQLSI